MSHDRFFLDRVVRRIIEVDSNRIQDYRGNYSDYLKERAERSCAAGKRVAASERMDRETGGLHPPKHSRTEDKAGTVPAQAIGASKADRKAKDGACRK